MTQIRCIAATAWLVPFLAGLPGGATAGEQGFVLREHLGIAWRDELVTFTFEFPEGDCQVDSLRLTGPSGPVPVQVVRSTPWPGDGLGLRSATIAFFASLGPRAADRYVLSWQSATEGLSPPPPSRLRIVRDGDLVTVMAAGFGAVFRTGSASFTQPVSGTAVPAPVEALMLPDGTRFGGSRMIGEAKLASWSGEIVAAGPVFADIRWHYRYAGGEEFFLRGRIGERDTAIYWDMTCRGSVFGNGWELVVDEGTDPVSFVTQIEFFSKRKIPGRSVTPGDTVAIPLKDEPPGTFASVTPWADWGNDVTKTVVFLEAAGKRPPFFAASRDPGAWMEPQETDASFMGGEPIWGRDQKSLPVVKREDGSTAVLAAVIDKPGGGLRRWITGFMPPADWQAATAAFRSRQPEIVQRQQQLLVDKRRLDWVKDFTLSWAERPTVERPGLFVSPRDILRARAAGALPGALAVESQRVRGIAIGDIPSATDGIALTSWLLFGTRQSAIDFKVVERLRHRLSLLGDFDLMRGAPIVAALYDSVIDAGLVTPTEREIFRAQMAYLAYRMEDPSTWSVERGYNASLPNMNVSYILGLGIVACALRDHPRAAEWCAPAIKRMDYWLEHDLGPQGEWMEGASYDHVTACTMVAFAIAARNAGFKDYSQSEDFRRFLLCIAKQYTPPDPTRGGVRATPPLGRANAGVRMGLFGVASRLMRDADPEYSAVMQWMWQQSGRLYEVSDNRLCGLEYVYIDPRLPARQPRWTTELFPRTTAVFRSRFGERDEDYGLVFFNPDIHFSRPSEVGSLLDWFAFGQPVAGAFTGGYNERHELLMTRVVPASAPTPQEWLQATFHRTSGGLTDFSAQRRLDYLRADFTIEKPVNDNRPMPANMPPFPPAERRGEPPIPWRRQLMFVKGESRQEPAYFVFRDTVGAEQPTLWQFWALSNGITAADRRAPAVKGVDGTVRPATPLAGNRFTASGQHGVDLDFFVVSPDDPQAHTLRWGTSYENPPDIGYTEYRDLLQLRRSGAGTYFVVVCPRRRGEQPPTVTAAAGGRAVRIRHSFGTDLVVLGEREPTEIDGNSFDVPVAIVQERPGRRTVTLGSAGAATVAGRVVSGDQPTSATFETP